MMWRARSAPTWRRSAGRKGTPLRVCTSRLRSEQNQGVQGSSASRTLLPRTLLSSDTGTGTRHGETLACISTLCGVQSSHACPAPPGTCSRGCAARGAAARPYPSLAGLQGWRRCQATRPACCRGPAPAGTSSASPGGAHNAVAAQLWPSDLCPHSMAQQACGQHLTASKAVQRVRRQPERARRQPASCVAHIRRATTHRVIPAQQHQVVAPAGRRHGELACADTLKALLHTLPHHGQQDGKQEEAANITVGQGGVGSGGCRRFALAMPTRCSLAAEVSRARCWRFAAPQPLVDAT